MNEAQVEENDELGDFGKLVNPNIKVIPDNSFTISIYYPLSSNKEMRLNGERKIYGRWA